ncbi:uncharacterized protein LOC103510458 [Diaphorina citri]|uniref:Uncharacterized protein LOC103510458 n=1 Tax=Diaphorina citri TaxID=121845 RepID=A0A3Q0J0Q7_DIACI|nr:uncharacterized protein LOC103510458 [Diaphorina citri]
MHYMHLCGLLCLPNFYRDPRKNSWHRVYSGAVLSLLGVYSVSITASLVLFAVNDLGEFCERLYEVLCVYICLLDLFFMRWNMDKYMDIVDIFETFERSHASNAILTRFQRTLKRILRVFFVVIFAMIAGLNRGMSIPQCVPYQMIEKSPMALLNTASKSASYSCFLQKTGRRFVVCFPVAT